MKLQMMSVQPSTSHVSVSGPPVTHGECAHDPRSTLHVVMHFPPMHLPLQFDPHDPQFPRSVFVSTQLDPQQLFPFMHAEPHAPQFALSFVVSTQTPLQHLSPQTLPHVPQFIGSVLRSRHVAPPPLSHPGPVS